jgi:hypothetical protein
MGDNLVALGRAMSFSDDKPFMTAYEAQKPDFKDEQKLWRIHTYCWAARSALSVAGDFVECGVFRGLYSAIMTAYLEFNRQAKRLTLYDTFTGLAEAYSRE